MNTNKPPHASVPPDSVNSRVPRQRSLVPKGITIGLAVFALVLSLAGYGFRLMLGEDLETVLRHAAVIVPAFVLGIPLFFWLGSRLLNKVKGCLLYTSPSPRDRG